MNFMKFIHCFC